ncbi:hypothetical protein ABBQ32_002320 [Trebouxia sp. C0010 RCD-2024]
MGTCPAFDLPTDVHVANSTATMGDPAGLSFSIEGLPFSTGGSTAVDIVLHSQDPMHSIYFVNVIESASAGFISIWAQRSPALGLKFAAKRHAQQYVVRYKLGPIRPQENVSRLDNSAHTMPRFISGSGTSRSSSSFSSPCDVTLTKGLLSNTLAEGLSFGIQATWQAGKLVLKRSCPSFRQLAFLAVLLWVLTSLRDLTPTPG